MTDSAVRKESSTASLVERLRDFTHPSYGERGLSHHPKIADEAADTIERLRAALEIVAYEGPAAVAAYNSREGIPINISGLREVARKALGHE